MEQCFAHTGIICELCNIISKICPVQFSLESDKTALWVQLLLGGE